MGEQVAIAAQAPLELIINEQPGQGGELATIRVVPGELQVDRLLATEKSRPTDVDARPRILFADIDDAAKGNKVKTALGLAVALSAVAIAACGGGKSGNSNPGGSSKSATAAQSGKCPTTWDHRELKRNEKHRILADGLPVIGRADTKREARQAVDKWWKVIRGDKQVSAQLAEEITGRNVDEAKLFKDGCATDYADGVSDRVLATLAASDIKPGQASKDGINTGLSGGRLVRNSAPGVSGNRAAADITLPNGSRFWVMSRCAQPVFEGTPSLPKGPTDEETPIPRHEDTITRVPGTPTSPPRLVCATGTVPFEQRCVHKAASGPPPEASQPPHGGQGPTPGYRPGGAEHIVAQQNSQPAGGLDPTPSGTQAGGPGTSPGGGEASVVSQPDATAPSNPAYQPGTASTGTSAGTSNEATSTAAQTEGTGQTSAAGSDPGNP